MSGLGHDGGTHGFDGPLIQAAWCPATVAERFNVTDAPPLAQELAHPTDANRKAGGDLCLRRTTRIHGSHHPPPQVQGICCWHQQPANPQNLYKQLKNALRLHGALGYHSPVDFENSLS